jgi:hypothetical protein
MYTGRAAFDMIGAPGEGIKKPKLKKYRVFVQSKGIGARPLGPNSLVLYEVKCDCYLYEFSYTNILVYN